MIFKIALFDKLYYYEHLLDDREFIVEGNKLYIYSEDIIKEFKLEGCNAKIDIDRDFNLNQCICYIKVLLNKWNDIEIYRGLYRLGKEVFINEVYDTIMRHIEVY